jgi:hypothetical protein
MRPIRTESPKQSCTDGAYIRRQVPESKLWPTVLTLTLLHVIAIIALMTLPDTKGKALPA